LVDALSGCLDSSWGSSTRHFALEFENVHKNFDNHIFHLEKDTSFQIILSFHHADFDGDQMALHVPQEEARLLIFSHLNLLSPVIVDSITVLIQDMLIRLYILTVRIDEVFLQIGIIHEIVKI